MNDPAILGIVQIFLLNVFFQFYHMLIKFKLFNSIQILLFVGALGCEVLRKRFNRDANVAASEVL